MNFLEHAPIRRKIMTIVLMTVGVALMVMSCAFMLYEYITHRATMIDQLTSVGEIVAENSTAALAFGDRTAAFELLSSLKAEDQIRGACLYDENNEVFSWYIATDTLEFPTVDDTYGYGFSEGYLSGFRPIKLSGKQIGTLYLTASMEGVYKRFRLYGGLAILILSLSLMIAYLFSRALQRQISGPIIELSETARIISERRDYTTRATQQGRDELGLLTVAFNQMLDEIQKQNLALVENEARITAFNQELETRVADRTAELQLANKELESFSYSVSHDLRAPLRSIHGYIQILNEEYADALNPEGQRLVGIVMNNARQMGQLIDDLLEFSRLGRKELTKSDVSMKDLAQDVFNELTHSASHDRIKLQLNEIPRAYADRGTIKQVWQNLISNAIKYSSKREVIMIEVGAFIKHDQTVYYVKDNGVGFDMEYYDKLFGVFQRLHSSSDFEGTGVGLAIVQRIVGKHGGSIWAEGQVDAGATFYFSIPSAG